jgi:hypothetical protein
MHSLYRTVGAFGMIACETVLRNTLKIVGSSTNLYEQTDILYVIAKAI